MTIPLDRLEEAERQRDRFTMLLAWIGSISLFVGGIGIMNIMLATVTERTREIGVRRALGAKRRDIVMQFLIEAMVQTTIGGMMGLGVSAWASSLFVLLVSYTVRRPSCTSLGLSLPSALRLLSASSLACPRPGVLPG